MLAAAGLPFAGKQAFRASQHTARPPACAVAGGPPPLCASCAGHTSPSAGPLTACNSCKQPLHPHPVCCLRVHDLTWCRPCLAAATSATRSRDADESSAEDTTSEDESSSSEGEEEEVEDEDDHLQLEEVADSHPPAPLQTPGSRTRQRGSSRRTTPPPPKVGGPDATPRPGLWTATASCASCLVLRPRPGRQPWPRRRARGPAAPPAPGQLQHRSTHKA